MRTVASPMATKNVWRAKMLETRSQLGPAKISELNRAICKNLSFVWIEGGGLSQQPNTVRPYWAGYKSFSWEADPNQAITDAIPFIRWIFPRVMTDTDLQFFEPLTEDKGAGLGQSGTRWLKNTFGIWEPDPQTAVQVDLPQCKGALVPGVAFDRRGHRLGYGKGFYDRALAQFKGVKVGVAFSNQVTNEELPNEELDIKMDFIVTDHEIIRAGRA